MKIKNKALALVLALILALTVCPLGSFAAETVDDLVIDDVTGSQVSTAIVSDLSLPAGYTWTSSDAETISIGEESNGVIPATVTRTIGLDKNVKLTASDGANTKEFDLVVKAKEVVVIASGTSAGGRHDVFTSVSNNDKTNDNLSILQESNGNYYQQYNFTYTNSNYDVCYLPTSQYVDLNKAEIVTFDFDFIASGMKITQPVDFRIKVGNQTLRLARWADNGRVYIGNEGHGVYVTASTTNWNHLTLNFNTYTGAINAVFNDTACNTSYVYNAAALTEQAFLDESLKNNICNIGFVKGASNSDCGTISIDNFCAYATLPTELSVEDQKAYIENLSWDDFCSEKASAVTNLTGNISNANGLINWSSDNPAITFEDVVYTSSNADTTECVGKTATVVRPEGKLNTNGIITATHKDGAEYGVKKFNVSVLPMNYTTDFRAESNHKTEILADFEEGSSGETIESISDESFKNDDKTSCWSKADATKANFVYVLDETKGMTAKISGADKGMFIKSGYSSDIHNNATVGMDIKFDEGVTAGSFVEIRLDAAVSIIDVFVRKDKIGFGTDNKDNKVWFNVDTSDWLRIDVDANLISRTNDIYVNGVKLNSIPMTNAAYYTTGGVSAQIRFVKFLVNGSAELLVDNIAVTCSGDADQSKAEAAIDAAKVYYGGKTLVATELPQRGPVFATKVDFAANGIAMDGGATLTWKENEATVTALNPTSPLEHTYTITATSGSKTITDSVSLKSAPVIINVDAEGNVTLTGNTTGGSLIVAAMDGSKLASVNVYTNFENINVSDIANYRLMFIDNFAELNPQAYSINK